MTKKQYERLQYLGNTLARWGFSAEETAQLRRISHTLHRWHELECGTEHGGIERENGDGTGKPYWTYHTANGAPRGRYAIADRESGALRRLAAIMARHPDCVSYVQGDPRGCALYIVPRSALADGAALDCCYSRGVAICLH